MAAAFNAGLRFGFSKSRSCFPCGARPRSVSPLPGSSGFQSTLPVRGATRKVRISKPDENGFQSTLPVRGATHANAVEHGWWDISIHAPRAGSDVDASNHTPTSLHFNPRSPCGERLCDLLLGHGVSRISIHAPRAGSDRRQGQPSPCFGDFNPRSPCGERRRQSQKKEHH